MATKKEWAAYFELINDRQPTAEETLTAIESGEISLESNGGTTNTANKAELTEDANRVYTNAKQHAGNYWTWIKPLLIHPSQNKDVVGTLFLWITFAIASVAGAFSASNIIRRGLNSALTTYSSFNTSEAATIRSQLSAFNTQFFFYIVIAFALFYIAAVPGLLLINRNKFSVQKIVTKYLKWFAPLALINLIGVILSFVVPIPSISVSEIDNISSFMQTIFSSFSIVVVILVIGIIILVAAQQFLITEANQNNQKIDQLWLIVLQWFLSAIVIVIELRFIIAPLLENLGKSIGNV